MGKIIMEFETEYEVGDIVLFEKDDAIRVGIIEGHYVDTNCDNSIWVDVRTGTNNVYTYSNGGDIAEADIIGKIDDADLKNACEMEIKEISG